MKRDLTDEQLNQTVNLSLPLHAVLRLADIDIRGPQAFAGRYDILPDCLPELGHPWIGLSDDKLEGIYAGLTLRHNVPMALVLLPGDEELSWSKAGDWAKAQGGELPSRADALMLWQNVPKQFQERYYWTSEEASGDADCAWVALFDDGGQGWVRKSDGYRCRAVRRVAI